MTDLETLQKARERVIESIANNMDLYGLTHSVGRLYGIMYFNDAPMTLEELGQSLGMSKTSMSVGVRILTDLKMVEKAWVKGERKDRYRAEDDWYQTFVDFFCIKWRKAIHINMENIQRSLSDLRRLAEDEQTGENVRKLAAKDIGKLNHALNFYKWLSRLIDSFETHEIFRFLPKTPHTPLPDRINH